MIEKGPYSVPFIRSVLLRNRRDLYRTVEDRPYDVEAVIRCVRGTIHCYLGIEHVQLICVARVFERLYFLSHQFGSVQDRG
jgi:hypothetical protein